MSLSLLSLGVRVLWPDKVQEMSWRQWRLQLGLGLIPNRAAAAFHTVAFPKSVWHIPTALFIQIPRPDVAKKQAGMTALSIKNIYILVWWLPFKSFLAICQTACFESVTLRCRPVWLC